ncbi:lamin tail domain-containing protein [candidate division WOR-3 bacterium]|uniref:Lamin tail domain-containing protein n=1 Tax=candidate division WOR-3 bacterium TaxID=2052148 RepID=A0A937XJC8_UNCW3|nr:lamin tail domain-containing protein [candidate division WOR-3 bacterium]
MTKLLACLLFSAAVAAANPYVLTFLSEVSVDSVHKFVELHGEPDDQSMDLNGWQLVTTTSACTLTHYLQYNEFLVVDSEALALREAVRGTLSLNPLGDSVTLLDSTGRVVDWVCYPTYPTGHGKAPLPPVPGSVAFWNFDDFEGQSMNWYVDSTPTPGWDNDDQSRIAGTLTGSGGVTLDEASVYASGTNGHCHCGLYQQTGYTISGLGAGTYYGEH